MYGQEEGSPDQQYYGEEMDDDMGHPMDDMDMYGEEQYGDENGEYIGGMVSI